MTAPPAWPPKCVEIENAWFIDGRAFMRTDLVAAAMAAALERAAYLAELRYPRGGAHTYASENADHYRATEEAAAEIATILRIEAARFRRPPSGAAPGAGGSDAE